MVIIFDLDGVIYLGETPISGAIPALHRLDSAGHRLFFLTNNSTRPRTTYSERLARMGYPARPEQIMTSAYATALYLRERGAAGKRVLVVGEFGLEDEMRAAGLIVIDGENGAPADFVVAGLDRQLTYDKLRRAFQAITGHGAAFIATNRDATYPLESGEIPGGGAIIAPIEVSTGVRPLCIGKPEPGCWQRILNLAEVSPAGALMVGDRPETDIQGAKSLGLRTVLVLSGVTSQADLRDLPPEQRPDQVLPSVAELPSFLERTPW